MIAAIRSVVLDTRNPRELADFWAKVLGGTILPESDDTWVVVTDPGSPLQKLAEDAGLGSATSLRQHLRSTLGVSPLTYRKAFKPPGPDSQR
ncbi:VOC family protein [Kibdelosporangium lantanae]|uniref:VOC family protein n=1 Tax=Kibdelosporangium lantanae TaxID=1497396 RepID=A0ABW3MJQ0_9PSEU